MVVGRVGREGSWEEIISSPTCEQDVDGGVPIAPDVYSGQ